MPEAVSESSSNQRKRREKRKRKNRKREKLIYNLKWLAGGMAAGLPIMAIMLYLVSR